MNEGYFPISEEPVWSDRDPTSDDGAVGAYLLALGAGGLQACAALDRRGGRVDGSEQTGARRLEAALVVGRTRQLTQMAAGAPLAVYRYVRHLIPFDRASRQSRTSTPSSTSLASVGTPRASQPRSA